MHIHGTFAALVVPWCAAQTFVCEAGVPFTDAIRLHTNPVEKPIKQPIKDNKSEQRNQVETISDHLPIVSRSMCAGEEKEAGRLHGGRWGEKRLFWLIVCHTVIVLFGSVAPVNTVV